MFSYLKNRSDKNLKCPKTRLNPIPSKKFTTELPTSPSSSQEEKNEAKSADSFRRRDVFWEEMYDQLKQFKNSYGHCIVPQKYPQLGGWVKRQRERKKKGQLSDDRAALLEKIGFVWQIRGQTCKTIESTPSHYDESDSGADCSDEEAKFETASTGSSSSANSSALESADEKSSSEESDSFSPVLPIEEVSLDSLVMDHPRKAAAAIFNTHDYFFACASRASDFNQGIGFPLENDDPFMERIYVDVMKASNFSAPTVLDSDFTCSQLENDFDVSEWLSL
jgi:hypothetical protein